MRFLDEKKEGKRLYEKQIQWDRKKIPGNSVLYQSESDSSVQLIRKHKNNTILLFHAWFVHLTFWSDLIKSWKIINRVEWLDGWYICSHKKGKREMSFISKQYSQRSNLLVHSNETALINQEGIPLIRLRLKRKKGLWLNKKTWTWFQTTGLI